MSATERFLRFEKRLRAAARRYDRSSSAIALHLAGLYLRRGFRPVEAIELGLADPAIEADLLSACFTKREMMALQDRLNPAPLTAVTEDKGIFYPYCDSLRLPVPKTYAVISARGGWIAPGLPLSDRDAWLDFIRDALPQSFVAKPVDGVYGAGVRVWTRDGEHFVDHAGTAYSAEDVHAACTGDRRHPRYLIQERIENHPSIVEVTGCGYLQTLRVVTLVDHSGQTHLLSAEWKLIVGDNVSDNLMHGLSGNLVANVALDDGRCGCARGRSEDGVGWKLLTRHPVTGQELDGYALPCWNDLRQIAVRAAELFLPLRTIGWDIALTPRGAVIIEGNRWWDPSNDTVLDPSLRPPARRALIESARRLKQEAVRS